MGDAADLFEEVNGERTEPDICGGCGGPATEFRDRLSRKEYGISGLYQKCQDKVFEDDLPNIAEIFGGR